MIYGIGTDIIEIERVEKACRRQRFLTHSFTEQERREAAGNAARLAGDFAVKEAVSKAFGTGIRGFSLTEIECLRNESGAPFVRLHGAAKELAKKRAVGRIHVSISDTKDYVIAMALAECKEEEE